MNKNRLNQFLLSLTACVSGINGWAEGRPNVLIIHTDEHNFRTLGCYRECLSEAEAFPWGKGVAVETPHIDALARHGVLFTRCYATSPVSSPSRSSFLTGLYPQHAGVWTNDMTLKEEALTFADLLRSHGYATGYIGKLHLNGKGRPEWQPERDFGFTDHRYMYNRGHWKKITDNASGQPEFRPADLVQTADSLTFTTDYLTNRAIDFIRSQKDSAFCCLLALPDPHSANQVRPPYDTMYTHLPFRSPLSAAMDTVGMPAWAHGDGFPEDRPEDMAQYFGMVKCIDDAVGRLLAVLKEAGVLEQTLIVFTSDHGDMCGQHGLINKNVPMDDASRVPFIVSYPAVLPEGIRVEPVVSVVDFTPSLLSVCGIETDQPFDGRLLSDLWRGKKLPDTYKDITFMRAPTEAMLPSDWDYSRVAKRSLWVAAVTPEYKLVHSENATDAPWLTDLTRDPAELRNCYPDPAYRQVVHRLTHALKAYGEEQDDPRVSHPKIQAEMNKVLTSK